METGRKTYADAVPSFCRRRGGQELNQSPGELIYGGGLEAPFAVMRARVVRLRLIQGVGLELMGFALAVGVIYTQEWAVALIVLFALGFGALAIREAFRFRDALQNVAVREEGIQFPMQLGRLGGTSLLRRAKILRVDLHVNPYGPLVEFTLRGRDATSTVVLEKEFIFDWAAFVASLRRLGIISTKPPVSPPTRGTTGRFRNHYGVRRLRGQGVFVGGLAGVILAVSILSIPDPLPAVGVGLAMMLMLLGYFLFINRLVPLDIFVDQNTLSVRTMTRTREFPVNTTRIFVGGIGILIQDQSSRSWIFDFVNPDDAAALWPAVS